MAPDNAPSLGELTRNVESLAREVRELVMEMRQLSTVYVPRPEHELQVGGLKVDVRRIEEQCEEDRDVLHKRVDDLKRDAAQERRDRVAGTRWAIGLAVTSLGLLVTGVLALFTIMPILLGGAP